MPGRYKILATAALFVLPGCAGSLVGDAIRGPEKLARDDDAYCRSIGAADGPAYTNCRVYLTQRRDNKHEKALDRLSNATRPTVQCTTIGGPGASTTTCY